MFYFPSRTSLSASWTELDLDALPDGVVVADARGRVTHVNATAARLLGVPDAVGKHITDVVALADREGNDWFSTVAPYDGLAIRTGLSEAAWYLSDGRSSWSPHAWSARSGPVELLVVALRSARARERLDRERSDLVATVAHELRSPLTGVKGFVATLLSKWDKLNDDQKQLMLETVNADADRLTRLIAELLDVARIDTGRLSLFRASARLPARGRPSPAVGPCRHGSRHRARGRGRPAGHDADPDKLVQVVNNLVENAVRHGEGRVHLWATAVPEEDPFAGSCCVSRTRARGSARHPLAGVHQVLEARHPRGLRPGHVHRPWPGHRPRRHDPDRRRPAGGARITIAWPAYDATT